MYNISLDVNLEIPQIARKKLLIGNNKNDQQKLRYELAERKRRNRLLISEKKIIMNDSLVF